MAPDVRRCSNTPGAAARPTAKARCSLEHFFAIEILGTEKYFSVNMWTDGRGGGAAPQRMWLSCLKYFKHDSETNDEIKNPQFR
jgi:hypothetical protein